MSTHRPFLKKHLRRLRYHWACAVAPHTVSASGAPAIDVLIPAVEKDLEVLPLCVEGVRRCVLNPIAEIYLVAPDTDAMRAAARQLRLEFVDERRVIGYGPRDIKCITASGHDRSGWMYQQLLKLSGAVGNSPQFLVIDADHILLRGHTFVTADNRLVMYRSSEYHRPYYEAMKRLIGVPHEEALSYVAHKMIFDRRLLNELRACIESRSDGIPWDKAIIAAADLSGPSPFSEYETFGHFTPSHRKISLPWRQKTLRKGATLPDYLTLRSRHSRYMSVTFPDYLKITK